MGLQYSDSRVIYKVRRTQVTPSLICSGSTADPQILLDQIACACRLEVSGTGIYILSIGMCCGMPGVQSHHYDRLQIRGTPSSITGNLTYCTQLAADTTVALQ